MTELPSVGESVSVSTVVQLGMAFKRAWSVQRRICILHFSVWFWESRDSYWGEGDGPF